MSRKYLLFFLISLNVFNFSCLKSSHEPSNTFEVNQKIKKEITVWMQEQKSTLNTAQIQLIDSLISSSKWTESKGCEIKNNQILVYLPISSSEKVSRGAIVFFDQKKNKVDSMFYSSIINIGGTKNSEFNAANILFRHYIDNSSHLTGLITFYSVSNELKHQFAYSGGKYLYQSTKRSSPKLEYSDVKVNSLHSNSTASNSTQCYNVYWVTTFNDGSQTWDFMYSYCNDSDPCETTKIDVITGIPIKTNCGGGGGAGAGGDGMTSELAEFQISYKTQMSPSELRIFENEMNLTQRIAYLKNAKYALDLAASTFPQSQHNGKGDAFRHTLFLCLNSSDLGIELAKRLSDAHEERLPIVPLEVQMDLRNNAIGMSTFEWLRSYGFTGTDYFREMAVIKVNDLLDNGGLWIINNLNLDGSVGPNSALVRSF